MNETIPTPAELEQWKKVGRYIRSTDPAMVEQIRDAGGPTDLIGLGQMMSEADPEGFERIVSE